MSWKRVGKDKMIGSGHVGQVEVNYQTLVDIFGEPKPADVDVSKYKMDARWCLEFEDGKIATIYNYKDGVNYLGADGKKTEEITEWHIGGFQAGVYDRVLEVIDIDYSR